MPWQAVLREQIATRNAQTPTATNKNRDSAIGRVPVRRTWYQTALSAPARCGKPLKADHALEPSPGPRRAAAGQIAVEGPGEQDVALIEIGQQNVFRCDHRPAEPDRRTGTLGLQYLAPSRRKPSSPIQPFKRGTRSRFFPLFGLCRYECVSGTLVTMRICGGRFAKKHIACGLSKSFEARPETWVTKRPETKVTLSVFGRCLKWRKPHGCSKPILRTSMLEPGATDETEIRPNSEFATEPV